jgi:CheY-like chemotaxis protein
MDGRAFVCALRRLLPDIPVIIASGRLDEDDLTQFNAFGVYLTLDKPFTQQQMAEVLWKALRGSVAATVKKEV